MSTRFPESRHKPIFAFQRQTYVAGLARFIFALQK